MKEYFKKIINKVKNSNAFTLLEMAIMETIQNSKLIKPIVSRFVQLQVLHSLNFSR